MSINIVVAIGNQNQIGLNGRMPWHIPEELKYFKSLTMGGTILMGRKTFESIGKPLTGRTNLVLTRDLNYFKEGITIVSSVAEAINKTRQLGHRSPLFIIGGGEVYKQAIGFCNTLFITQVDYSGEADTYFPDITKDFEMVEEEYRTGWKPQVWKRK